MKELRNILEINKKIISNQNKLERTRKRISNIREIKLKVFNNQKEMNKKIKDQKVRVKY